MISTRRGFLTGLGSLLAAPAIVHAGNLMPVKVMKPTPRIHAYRALADALYGEPPYFMVVPQVVWRDLIECQPQGITFEGEIGRWDYGTIVPARKIPPAIGKDFVLVDCDTKIVDVPRLETRR